MRNYPSNSTQTKDRDDEANEYENKKKENIERNQNDIFFSKLNFLADY